MARRNPYKLFSSYGEEDADVFFGRELEVSSVVGDILLNKLLVLFARSGSGKTSLLNAGIGPALKQLGGTSSGNPEIRLVTIRLSADCTPEQSAVAALRGTLGIPEVPLEMGSLHGALKALCSFDLKVVPGRNPLGLVLVFDQFEELFISLFGKRPEVRRKFAAQLAEIIHDESLRAYVVLSLRSDHFHHLNEFRSVLPSIFQNNTNLELHPFDDEAALRVIRGPSLDAENGFRWEKGLPERIRDDLKAFNTDNDGVLPIHLQIVCYGLWESLQPDEDCITNAHYEHMLDAQARHRCESPAATMIRKRILAPLAAMRDRRRPRDVYRTLRELITKHQTKAVRALSDLYRVVPAQRLDPILDDLGKALLLRREYAAADQWVELQHDFLAKEILPWLDHGEVELRRQELRRRLLIAVALIIVTALLTILLRDWNTYTARLGFDEERPNELIISRQPAFGLFAPAWWKRDVGTMFQRSQLLAAGIPRYRFDVANALSDWKDVEVQIDHDPQSVLRLATRLTKQAMPSEAKDPLIFDALTHPEIRLFALYDEAVRSKLAAAVKDGGKPELRTKAASTLANLGPFLPREQAQPLLGPLLETLRKSEADFRLPAAIALSGFGSLLNSGSVKDVAGVLLTAAIEGDTPYGMEQPLEHSAGFLDAADARSLTNSLFAALRSKDAAKQNNRRLEESAELFGGLRPEILAGEIPRLLSSTEIDDDAASRLLLGIRSRNAPNKNRVLTRCLFDGLRGNDPHSKARAATFLSGLKDFATLRFDEQSMREDMIRELNGADPRNRAWAAKLLTKSNVPLGTTDGAFMLDRLGVAILSADPSVQSAAMEAEAMLAKLLDPTGVQSLAEQMRTVLQSPTSTEPTTLRAAAIIAQIADQLRLDYRQEIARDMIAALKDRPSEPAACPEIILPALSAQVDDDSLRLIVQRLCIALQSPDPTARARGAKGLASIVRSPDDATSKQALTKLRTEFDYEVAEAKKGLMGAAMVRWTVLSGTGENSVTFAKIARLHTEGVSSFRQPSHFNSAPPYVASFASAVYPDDIKWLFDRMVNDSTPDTDAEEAQLEQTHRGFVDELAHVLRDRCYDAMIDFWSHATETSTGQAKIVIAQALVRFVASVKKDFPTDVIMRWQSALNGSEPELAITSAQLLGSCPDKPDPARIDAVVRGLRLTLQGNDPKFSKPTMTALTSIAKYVDRDAAEVLVDSWRKTLSDSRTLNSLKYNVVSALAEISPILDEKTNTELFEKLKPVSTDGKLSETALGAFEQKSAPEDLATIASHCSTETAMTFLPVLEPDLYKDVGYVDTNPAVRILASHVWPQPDAELLQWLESNDSVRRLFALHVLARRPSLKLETINRITKLRNDVGQNRPWVQVAALRCLEEMAREKFARDIDKATAERPKLSASDDDDIEN